MCHSQVRSPKLVRLYFWPTQRQNVTLLKVVFKINFRPFWVILVKKFSGEKKGGVSYLAIFWSILGFWKFLQVFDISRGQKTLFFKKCPNSGLVSEKKYIVLFVTIGGVRPNVTFVTIFFFFFNEPFPYWGTFWKKVFFAP